MSVELILSLPLSLPMSLSCPLISWYHSLVTMADDESGNQNSATGGRSEPTGRLNRSGKTTNGHGDAHRKDDTKFNGTVGGTESVSTRQRRNTSPDCLNSGDDEIVKQEEINRTRETLKRQLEEVEELRKG